MYQEQHSEKVIYSFDEGHITKTDCSEWGGLHYIIYFKDEDFKYAEELNNHRSISQLDTGYDEEKKSFYFIFIDKDKEMNEGFFSNIIEIAKDEIREVVKEAAENTNKDVGVDVASQLVELIEVPSTETDHPAYLGKRYFEIKDDFQNTVFEELENVFTANDFFEACEDNDNRIEKIAEEYIAEYKKEMEN